MKTFISVLLVFSNIIVSGYAMAELKDFSGKPGAIADYAGKGKWTAVIIWASDCHVCNVEAEQYIQFHEAHKDKDIQMLGVSMDGNKKLDEAKAFVKRHHVTYPNLIGEPVDVASMYERLTGASWVGTPTILVYDPQGELQAAQPGAVPVELIEEFVQTKTQEAATAKKAD